MQTLHIEHSMGVFHLAKNAQQVAEKWSRNLSASTQDIAAGVDAVTQAPGAAAAARQQEMLAKLTQSVQSGKWAARVSAVSLPEWKRAMKEKGIQRVSSGAQAAAPKVAQFMQEFLPVAQGVSDQIKSMPKLTIEDSIARSAAAIRAFRAFGEARR